MHALDEVWLLLGHVLVTTLPAACAPGAVFEPLVLLCSVTQGLLGGSGQQEGFVHIPPQGGASPLHFPLGSTEMCCHNGNPSKNETVLTACYHRGSHPQGDAVCGCSVCYSFLSGVCSARRGSCDS